MPPYDRGGAGQPAGVLAAISRLKVYSLQKMNGKYGMTVAVTVLILALNFFFSIVISLIVPPENIFLFAASEFVVFLVDLLMGMLVSGRTYLYMNILYDRTATFGDLKQGFTEHPEKAVLLQVPFALAACIAAAPMSYYQIFYLTSPDRQVLFVCLLISLAGFIGELVLSLIFSQVFYLLHDFPERKASELFAASARLMKGHIGQYFLLLLSFLPWLFLSVLLFFIPALFIMSQMYAAQTAFYQSLTNRQMQ